MLRSLRYHWRMNLAVLLGAAVTTAVLTGALLVGDSVRGSLRDLTLDRLGKVDDALFAPRFFREELIAELSSRPDFRDGFEEAIPLIQTPGAAVHTVSRRRASGINVYGVDDRFSSLFGADLDLDRRRDQAFESVAINESLRQELGARVGDQLLIHLQRQSEIHPESFLGSRDPSAVVQAFRVTLTAVLPDRGAGRFTLRPNQAEPLNAYLKLPALQQALEERGKVNSILFARRAGVDADSAAAALSQVLEGSLDLSDLGLRVLPDKTFLSLQSDQFVLAPWVVAAANAAADNLSAASQHTLTYLANSLEAKGKSVPYSTVTAVDPASRGTFPSLYLTDGSTARRLEADQILLNQWAAAELGVSVGDDLEMSYYAVGPRNELGTERAGFKIAGVVALRELGADRTLTPEFPGINDQEDMSAWDPPFPVALDQVRPQDERYWDDYRTTPKAFVSEATGVRLWRSRFGEVTSLRVSPYRSSAVDIASFAESFERELLMRMGLEAAGFVLNPVKERGLRAAEEGPTDFAMLFTSFSFFLIISALLIVALLFRLSVEQRAHEVGLLLSVGYSRRRVLVRFLSEGGILAASGAVLGLAGALLYGWLLMSALRTWWLSAVGTTFLFLHVTPSSLGVGYLIGVLVVILSVWLAIRKLVSIPTPSLLAGATGTGEWVRPARRARIVAWITLAGALVLLLVLAAGGQLANQAGPFFGIGALLLISGLAFLLGWCRDAGRRQAPSLRRPLNMAARNGARNPGRSVLSVALVASACFVIVAVGAFRTPADQQWLSRESGTGGFALVAQSDIPLLQDLGTEEGRLDLGFQEEDSEKLARIEGYPFRLLPGDDTSCLNLYKPEKPRLLGVPPEMAARGGFRFAQTREERENPWTLLDMELEDGMVPAFGDHESVLWILHSGLGQDLVIEDEQGRELKLRLVGLIQNSIFQGEILISEQNFLKYFPSRTGYAYFLIDTLLEDRAEVSEVLERTLTPFGFDAIPAEEKLAGFQAVRSTYISTFLSLGGLGLLLGTLGLGIVLIRNVIERRGELATLRAFGFRRATLAWMVVAENGFLLLLGVAIGTLSALVAILPSLVDSPQTFPWLSLALTLLLVIAVGMLSSAAALRAALRIPLLPALKAQ